jgi:hypothetical protein
MTTVHHCTSLVGPLGTGVSQTDSWSCRKTVFDQRMFSTVKGETGGSLRLLRGTDEPEKSEGDSLFNVNVPTN